MPTWLVETLILKFREFDQIYLKVINRTAELLKDESWGHFSIPALFLNEAVYNLANQEQIKFNSFESFHEDRLSSEELINLRKRINAENFRTQYLQCEYDAPNSVIHAPKDVENVQDLWYNKFVISGFND